jgi:hypothetical protein
MLADAELIAIAKNIEALVAAAGGLAQLKASPSRRTQP